jgi:ribosome biogenesis GTPase A
MIVGIPNVGKSTLINALSHGKKASVAPKPGHTRALQKINISETFELLDSPGILWHKFDDEQTGQRLAMLGAIKDDVYDFSVIVHLTIAFLLEHYPNALPERYRLTTTTNDPEAILEEIGRKRGYLIKGGGIDMERTYTNLMNDFRTGALGRISLERA